MESSTISTTTKAEMSSIEQNLRLGIGAAAAATAIFAPLGYKWKFILTGIAATGILTGVYEVSPLMRLFKS